MMNQQHDAIPEDQESNVIKYEDVLINGEKPQGPISLSSPNKMIWEHFSTIELLLKELDTEKDASVITRKSALILHLSVLAFETFFNIYFYIFAKESQNINAFHKIANAITERRSIEWKLKNFTQIAFGKNLDLQNGHGLAFFKMKNERNSIMHFEYSATEMRAPGICIQGLADTAFYSQLGVKAANTYYEIAINTIWEVFRLSGMNNQQIIANLHGWAGIMLTNDFTPQNIDQRG